MNRIEYTVTQDVLADKGIRFANYIIDYIIQIGLGAAIGFVLGVISELTGNYALIDFFFYSGSIMEFVFGYLILLLYYTVFETLTGRTLAKFITKTKVVLYDGSKPSFNEILVRSLCRLIPFEQFSFLGNDSKGWHDSISKTYVVDIKKFEAKKQTFEELDEIGRIGE
nr:RDD family protein [uncultured Psychroserpens sp.]